MCPRDPEGGSTAQVAGRLIQLPGVQETAGPMWPALRPRTRALYALMERAYFARRIPELMRQTDECAPI